MPEGQVLEFSGVTKRFGAVTAVDDFAARVEPGQVTGFLGPNGAGKTTTLRILLGLVRASSGVATIGGVPYARLRDPLRTVGAVLEASSFHPGRTGANHLRVYSQAAGLPDSRVDEALGMVGLADVGGRKVGGYSLGMRQRLGLAYALLGDPGVLVLDEPANGLDPEGIKWMRGLLRELARQGRTVLVSSHLLAEVQQTVDSLLIIAQGRLVFQGPLHELTDPSEYVTVVDSPDRAALAGALRDAQIEPDVLRSGLTVRGADTATVGRIAAGAGIALSSLQRRGPALEEVFLDLVNGIRVHASATGASAEAADEAPEDTASAAEAAADEAEPEEAADDAEDVSAGAEPLPSETAEHASETETTDEPAATEAAPAAFVVASTGIIDVVPAAGPATTDAADSEPAAAPPDDAPGPALPPRAWWVPADVKPLTGAVEVADEESREADAEAESLESGEAPDVSEGDAIEEIDADLEQPDLARTAGDTDSDDSTTADSDAGADAASAPDSLADPDRPWQEYVKTDSDVEADRFFAAFDEGDAAQGEASGSAAPAATPSEGDAEAAPPDSGAGGDAEAATHVVTDREDDEEGDQR